MKYTRLSLQDLKDLEKEFIEFLILNGIDADEWERLKVKDTDKVEQVIDHFSDVIWEGVLRKTEMVEHRRADKLTVCRVKKGELTTLLIRSLDSDLNFTKQEDLDGVFKSLDKHDVSVHTDAFDKPDTEQLFELLQVGFYISTNPAYEELMDEKL
ncbi:MAG TPA: DUF6495 family protein [Brumimicrobium sp.]|nr:DUF6495 family protein [Brumimicrobium sp.]